MAAGFRMWPVWRRLPLNQKQAAKVFLELHVAKEDRHVAYQSDRQAHTMRRADPARIFLQEARLRSTPEL